MKWSKTLKTITTYVKNKERTYTSSLLYAKSTVLPYKTQSAYWSQIFSFFAYLITVNILFAFSIIIIVKAIRYFIILLLLI